MPPQFLNCGNLEQGVAQVFGKTTLVKSLGPARAYFKLDELGALGHPVALYFTGLQHAGENLAAGLRRRRSEREPPIQMRHALWRNQSSEFQSILAHCLSHGRREFVSVAENCPDECHHVLKSRREV